MIENQSISIVMPLFNKAETIALAIRSIQNQHKTEWELVVVDDGSTDSGVAIIEDIGDPRIRIIRQANSGVSAARNRGITEASYELIAFLDADDEWRPNFLHTIVSLAKDFPDAGWFGTSYEIRHTREGQFFARLKGIATDFKRGLLKEYFHVALRSDPPVHSSAVAVRRSAILSIGGFPFGISSGEDLLTWARLALHSPLAYDSSPLAIFHVSGHDRPADPDQQVGKALSAISAAHSSVAGLRAYVGLWYRMQAVMAMRFEESALARRCAWLAFMYGPVQWRNGYTLLLSWLPSSASRGMDATLRRWVRRHPSAERAAERKR